MGSNRDRLVVNLLLAVLVFVGVSSSVSDTLDAFYSVIAFWTFIIGGVFAAIGILTWWLDFDRSLDREAAESWKTNGEITKALAERHAAHPEVARDLAARMAEEKVRQEQMKLGIVPPPKGA